MKGLLLSISILLSMSLVFWIQTFHFNMGYLIGVVLIALHFFAVSFYATKKED